MVRRLDLKIIRRTENEVANAAAATESGIRHVLRGSEDFLSPAHFLHIHINLFSEEIGAHCFAVT